MVGDAIKVPLEIRKVSKGPRKSVIILSIVCVILLGVSLVLFIAFDNEQAQRIELGGKLKASEDSLKNTEEELFRVQKSKEQLESNLEDTKVQIGALESKLNEETSNRKLNESQLVAVKGQYDRLVNDFNAVSTQKNDLSLKLSQLEFTVKDLKDKLAVQDKLNSVEAAIKAGAATPEKPGVDLEKIIVSAEKPKGKGEPAKEKEPAGILPPQEKPKAQDSAQAKAVPEANLPKSKEEKKESDSSSALPLVEGKVLAVHREYEFVVVSLGKNNQINPKDMLLIIRGPETLAKVQVERVYDTMCSANFLDKAAINKVKEGDKVIKE